MAEQVDSRKKVKMTGFLGTKVPMDMEVEVKELCKEKDWDVSKFLRQAIQESIDKVRGESDES